VNAGIKNGDVIIAVDGQRIDSATALVAQIREMTAGDKTTLTVIRNGARQDVPVTLAVKPASSN
jgi:putative serine protease PepD